MNASGTYVVEYLAYSPERRCDLLRGGRRGRGSYVVEYLAYSPERRCDLLRGRRKGRGSSSTW